MKSGNINTRNTEKDIIVDLNVHFFLPCCPDQTFHNPRLLNCANHLIEMGEGVKQFDNNQL